MCGRGSRAAASSTRLELLQIEVERGSGGQVVLQADTVQDGFTRIVVSPRTV